MKLYIVNMFVFISFLMALAYDWLDLGKVVLYIALINVIAGLVVMKIKSE